MYISVSTGIMSAIRFVCFLSFILSVFLHFLLLYFVVISLSLFSFCFFCFFFLGARPYAAIFFNVPAGGANGHGKKEEEEEAHNNNMENIATSEDN